MKMCNSYVRMMVLKLEYIVFLTKHFDFLDLLASELFDDSLNRYGFTIKEVSRTFPTTLSS